MSSSNLVLTGRASGLSLKRKTGARPIGIEAVTLARGSQAQAIKTMKFTIKRIAISIPGSPAA